MKRGLPQMKTALPFLANLRRLGALAALVALSSCSSAPPATFDLSAAPAGKGGRAAGTIVVGEPVALSLIDSDRIVVRLSAGSVAYIPGAQWADRLPKLLQTRLIESFENARRVGSVGRPGDRLVASTRLNAEIRTFEVQEKTGEAVVEITARIVNDRTGQIVAGQLFSARTPVSGVSGPTAAAALDVAAQAVFAQIVVWSARGH